MEAAKFETVWLEQVSAEKAMLLERADAYATGGDRLGNFKEGSQLAGNHPMQYGFGLVVKHIIALRDLIGKIAKGQGKYDERELEKFAEYTQDIRNYAVLLKALYLEERGDRDESILQREPKRSRERKLQPECGEACACSESMAEDGVADRDREFFFASKHGRPV